MENDIDITQLTTTESHAPLQKIGQGFCGTVWADPCPDVDTCSTAVVLKREDGGPGRSLLQEYNVHRHLLSTLQTNQQVSNMATFRVNIPFCVSFLQRESTEWANILGRLPPQFTACNASVSERIMPMPQQVRHRLAQMYWDGDASSIMDDNTNHHCLIRPYLGRRRIAQQPLSTRARPTRLKVFSLRNFPLHIDQIEELGLPAEEYAIAMADALAFLHWAAKVDANDVEFVLARPRPPRQSGAALDSRPSIGSREFTSDVAFGQHAMWILDFDCCRELSMDESGIEQAAKSFWRNDPYYPRPGSSSAQDQELWDVFKIRFLHASGLILKEEDEAVRQLPRSLVARIIETHGTWTNGLGP